MSATEAHQHAPFIDYENLPAPTKGILVTHFITVRSVARSRAFYSEVLGGQVVMEENPCIVKLANSWILMNPGGPPTPDKPDISVVNYEPGNAVSTFLNLRVADIQACYEQWSSKGAEFVTPPIDRRAEVRCYMRDPDGYMIEVGQATGALHGELATKDLKACPAKGDGSEAAAERGQARSRRLVHLEVLTLLPVRDVFEEPADLEPFQLHDVVNENVAEGMTKEVISVKQVDGFHKTRGETRLR
jgi:catechol 2,3-dioxygenase-like lactoylglutathione lyase family enzyme